MTPLQQLQEEGENKINEFIRKHISPDLITHLIDSDENDGQRLRKHLGMLIGKSFLLGQLSGIELSEEINKKLSSHRFTGMYAEFARSGYDTCVNEMASNLSDLKQKIQHE